MKVSKYNQYYILALITLIGGYLRFHNLGLSPLWIDEAFFAIIVKNGIWEQEFIPHFLTYIFNPETEFGFRVFSALAGTLSITAIYFVLKKYRLFAAFFIAFNPIFIFWSQMARPYSMAGLFMILGWRYWWAYLPAMLTTPISLIGVRILDQKKWLLVLLAGLAVGFYLIRPDVGRQAFTDIRFIIISTRWFYLCLISLCLYSCDYFLPFIEGLSYRGVDFGNIKKIYPAIIIALSLFFLSNLSDIMSHKNEMLWYRQECKISDWRNIGKVDYATEVDNAEWYGGGEVGYFQHWGVRGINSSLIAGDTLTIGLGQLAIGVCAPFIMKYIGGSLYKYAPYISDGKVIKLKIWVKDNRIYQSSGIVL